MNRIYSTSPEVFYGDVTAKMRAYAALSQRYAAEGRSFQAVHAAWAADVHTVQALMWERVMVASPCPDEAFFALADTISQTLSAYAESAPVADDAQDAVLGARQAMASAFDQRARSILDDRYASLDYLAGLAAPDPSAGRNLAAARLAGGTVTGVTDDRRRTAKECMTAALSAERAGRTEEAVEQAWRADWATFEAYLLDAAALVGDESLVTVEMRWALACQELTDLGGLPSGFADAVGTVRSRMAAVLGPVEGARLAERFIPLA